MLEFKLWEWLHWIASQSICNSEELIKTIDLQIFMISGREDHYIPPVKKDILFKAAELLNHSEYFKVKNNSHKDTCKNAEGWVLWKNYRFYVN